MRRSTVLILPPQIVFPAQAIYWVEHPHSKLKTRLKGLYRDKHYSREY
jgi:hypothetical protein